MAGEAQKLDRVRQALANRQSAVQVRIRRLEVAAETV